MSHKILILGATGRTGKHAIPLALARGYRVVALVRNPAKISVKSEGLTIVKGLPTDIDDVRKAMKGCDAVLSLLAPLTSWRRDLHPENRPSAHFGKEY